METGHGGNLPTCSGVQSQDQTGGTLRAKPVHCSSRHPWGPAQSRVWISPALTVAKPPPSPAQKAVTDPHWFPCLVSLHRCALPIEHPGPHSASAHSIPFSLLSVLPQLPVAQARNPHSCPPSPGPQVWSCSFLEPHLLSFLHPHTLTVYLPMALQIQPAPCPRKVVA